MKAEDNLPSIRAEDGLTSSRTLEKEFLVSTLATVFAPLLVLAGPPNSDGAVVKGSAAIPSAPILTEARRQGIATALEPVLANPPATGLLVYDVLEGSQSAKAGIKIGDVITHYDGQVITQASQLRPLLQQAIQERRQQILIAYQRGPKTQEAEFAPAPLGLRLVPITKSEPRVLWRPETKDAVDPSLARVSEGHRWELLEFAGKKVGWAHSFVKRDAAGWTLRIQSRVMGGADEKHDVTLGIAGNRFLSPRSIRLASKDKLILDAQAREQKWVGHRAGVAVAEYLPSDTVSSHAAGLLAATMPLRQGAGLRFSFLDDASLAAAPFADLVCLGEEKLTLNEQVVLTARFELSVFGATFAHYWIDARRKIVKTRFAHGMEATLTNPDQLVADFPTMEQEFPPIDETAVPPLSPRAN